MKQLPYRTIWVEYPDIEALYRVMGIESTEVSKEGTPLYCLPVIYDPRTDRIICDSIRIARYLDETYPSSSPLFPVGMGDWQALFVATWIQKVSDPLHIITSQYAAAQLPLRSAEYYRSVRGKRYGKPLDQIAPPGSEDRRIVWAKVRLAMKQCDPGSITTTFAYVCVASYLIWFKRLLGVESMEWQELMSAENGRWRNIVENMGLYEKVDAEGLIEPIWQPPVYTGIEFSKRT